MEPQNLNLIDLLEYEGIWLFIREAIIRSIGLYITKLLPMHKINLMLLNIPYITCVEFH